MMLNDKQIRKLSEEGMITPFVNSSKDLLQGLSFLDKPTSFKTLSYGLGSFGYDVRLADTVKVFTPINVDVIDPKRPNERALVTLDVHTSESGERWVVLPPNSYALGHTVETFDIPRDISVIALGKSTYARNMIILNVTPIEAGEDVDAVFQRIVEGIKPYVVK